jgi:hypothetical protein
MTKEILGLPRSKVGVVILNYNNAEDTCECLRSIRSSRYRYLDFVVVVDNGSNDLCIGKLRRELGSMNGVKLLEVGGNLGFAAGMNMGIEFVRRRGCEHVLILNNDTAVEPDCIDRMVERIEMNPLVGIVSPKVRDYNKRDRLWSAGSRKGLQYAKDRGTGQLDVGQFDEAEPIEFANGCGMMITGQAIAKLSGFDERFFFGGEDRELSLRCRKAGLEVWYEPRAVIYHKKGELRRTIPKPERLYMGYLTQLFYIKISRSKLRWFLWYGIYMVHFSTILPVRLFLEHGVNAASLICIGASWLAWIEAFHADRAYPRQIEKFSVNCGHW